MVCVSAPFDQLYEAKPGPASSVTLLFAQVDDGPLIVTAGLGLTVTLVGADVPEQPLAFVTVTLKLPETVAGIDGPFAPVIGDPLRSH
jgi:hypothetical protein